MPGELAYGVGVAKKKPNQQKRAKAEARRAARREKHAKLVVERHGDPNFPQRVRQPDGSYTVTMTPEAKEAILRQMELFKEKFGREPGPDDPLFFDPDADEPTFLTEGPAAALSDDELFQLSEHADVDPAYLFAMREVGYLPIETTQHMFSAHELEVFDEAVHKWRERLD